jgi:hypothetical protein
MKYRIKLRSFNDAGRNEFEQLLLSSSKSIFAELDALAANPKKSKELPAFFEWDSKNRTRQDLGAALYRTFTSDENSLKCADDPNTWNWLACLLFKEIHEGDIKLVPKIKGDAPRWIVRENTIRGHRHLVLGSYTSYKNNFDNLKAAQCILHQDIFEPGELVERIAGKSSLSVMPVVQVATWLYIDPKKNSPYSGITSIGTPQQLSKYLNQIEKNVDYQSMTPKELLKLLPPGFSRWQGLAKKNNPLD